MNSRGKLLNVGPKSSAWLRQVGIRTEEDLREAGAVAAFVKVKRAGFKPSLNLLYALEGALTGCHWQQVPAERRGAMLIEVDAAEAALPKPRTRAAAFAERAPVSDVTAEAQAEAGAEPSFGFDSPDSAGGDESHD